MARVGRLQSEISLPSVNIWMAKENSWYDYFGIAQIFPVLRLTFWTILIARAGHVVFADMVHRIIHSSTVGIPRLSYNSIIAFERIEIVGKCMYFIHNIHITAEIHMRKFQQIVTFGSIICENE